MPYLYNTSEDQQVMLEAIGAQSVDDLFDVIPDHLRLKRDLAIPPALTELELTQHMATLAARNNHSGQKVCFLGGGCYDHFIPAVVDTIASRSEFYTAYTPYQPEVSQGTLQVMFEYQTLVSQLTGMDVANASVYEGGSAMAEAVLMAFRNGHRLGNVVTTETVHPEYRQTMATYLRNLDADVITVGAPDGIVAPETLATALNERTACVVIQQPNFFGCLEEVDTLARMTHANGSLLVVVVDPISLGLLKRPAEYGADIVVAEGQSLGIPMSYGGPYLGMIACRRELMRRLPGRLVGETVDRHGNRCFVLTLQTREQHIRREKASSNICTNQALLALRATVYLAQLGPKGLRDTAQLCLQKSHRTAGQITESLRFSLRFRHPTFKEFVIRDKTGHVEDLLADACESGFLAGIPLRSWYPELSDCFLVAVTEKRTLDQIEALATVLHAGQGSRAIDG